MTDDNDRYKSGFERHLEKAQAQKSNVVNLQTKTPQLQWADNLVSGKKSASMESPLKCWYVEHSKLRAAGMRNEIDENEIKVAMRGTRNKWFERVQKNRELFQPIVEGKIYDWDAIKKLTGEKV